MAIRVKVTQIRVGYIDLKPENYPEGKRDYDSMVDIEMENVWEFYDYMDMIKADENFTFEKVK